MFSFITLFQRARVRWELSDFTRKYSAAIQFECDTRKIINFANLARCVRPSSNFTNFEDLPKWSSDQVTHFRRVLILTRLISTHEKECIESNGKKRSKLRNDEADSTRRATINQLLSRATDIKGYRKSWTIFFPISGFPLSLVTPYISSALVSFVLSRCLRTCSLSVYLTLSLSLSLSLSLFLSFSFSPLGGRLFFSALDPLSFGLFPLESAARKVARGQRKRDNYLRRIAGNCTC